MYDDVVSQARPSLTLQKSERGSGLADVIGVHEIMANCSILSW